MCHYAAHNADRRHDDSPSTTSSTITPDTLYPFSCSIGAARRMGAAPIEWPMSCQVNRVIWWHGKAKSHFETACIIQRARELTNSAGAAWESGCRWVITPIRSSSRLRSDRSCSLPGGVVTDLPACQRHATHGVPQGAIEQ
jgi:hypothetical protein